jgi:hypothetical protein
MADKPSSGRSAMNKLAAIYLGGILSGAFAVAALNPSGVLAQSRSSDANIGRSEMAFLSGRGEPGSEPEGPAQETPSSRPQQDNTDFDGAWIFTSAGCTRTGSLRAVIRRGKIIVRGGSGMVDPDGTLHSVGAGGGMTLAAVGQLSGNTGSGTFNRSDGCVGSWIAIKR